MALSDDNQNILREFQIVDLLAKQLNSLNEELLTDAASKIVEGVTIEDIIEGTCGALHVFARFPQNINIMKKYNTVHTAISILSRMSNQNIQRAATGLLCELSSDLELAQQIDKEPGAMRQLAHLLHCRNEAVATYAAATMHRLTDQKSDEEKKRMSVNLQNSLFHHNTTGNTNTLTTNNHNPNFNQSNNHGTMNTNGYMGTTLTSGPETLQKYNKFREEDLPSRDQTNNYVHDFNNPHHNDTLNGGMNSTLNSNYRSTYNRNHSNNNNLSQERGTPNYPGHNNSNNNHNQMSMAYLDKQNAYQYEQAFGNDNDHLLGDRRGYTLDTDV